MSQTVQDEQKDNSLEESSSDKEEVENDSSEPSSSASDPMILLSIWNAPIPLAISTTTSPLIVQPSLPDLPQFVFPTSSQHAAAATAGLPDAITSMTLTQTTSGLTQTNIVPARPIMPPATAPATNVPIPDDV
jgi:hypothetical protein